MAEKNEEASDRTRTGQVNFRTFAELVEDFERAIAALSARNERDAIGGSLSKSWLVEAMICRFLERAGESGTESRKLMQELIAANRAWIDRQHERLPAGDPQTSSGHAVATRRDRRKRA